MKSIVLVHAAFADGSSWNQVILPLQRLGFAVFAPQLPLTSLEDDVATLRRVLERAGGPVVLAAHSYGGAVITAAAAGEEKVQALAYIAAMAPDAGETVGQLLHLAEPHPSAPALTPDAHGFIWMPASGFDSAVAPDTQPDGRALMTATQRPISVQCLVQPAPHPAWKQKPSWYLLAANDRMIAPSTQRFMAERMKATIDEQPVDHTPLTSAPDLVVQLIARAAA